MPYPYVPSGGIIQQAIDQFKKALPSKVDAATLKKLGVAPSNEGYVINTLKFLGLVDSDNSRTDDGVALFATHGDAFAPALEAIVREKYNALFELRGDEAWRLDRDALISFFRQTDKTSATVGARQALTFVALASMSGKREAATRPAPTSSPKPRAAAKPKVAATKPSESPSVVVKDTKGAMGQDYHSSDVALTVRIEINLPANGSQATYDNIFKSIRQNLLKQDD